MTNGAIRSRRRARLQAAVASVVAGVAATAIPMIAGHAPVRAQVALAVVAMVALLLALIGWTPAFTLAAVAAGSEYSLRLVSQHGADRLDAVAVLEAVAVFAMIEIGLRSRDARTIARPERAVRMAALWRLAALLAGAGVAAFVVLAIGSRRLPAPTAGLALGLAAATALVASAELLRRRLTRGAAADR